MNEKLKPSRKQKVCKSFKEKAKILKLLEDKLKTQRDIAAEYGISHTTISNWKNQILQLADTGTGKILSKITKGKYDSNKSAWMDSKLFNAWLKKVDDLMIKRQKEIVLLVDNAPCHNLDPTHTFKNVTVQYISPNSTSILQPLDLGIIKSYKSFYRKALLRMIANKCQQNIVKKVTLLEAIYLTSEAWDMIEEKTIKNCFNHAFKSHNYFENNEMSYEADATEEVEELQKLLKTDSSFMQICNVEPSLVKETVNVNQIVSMVIENITYKNAPQDVVLDILDDEEISLPKKPEYHVVDEAVNTLKNFLATSENSDVSLFQSLNKIKKINEFEKQKTRKQTKLDEHGFVFK